MNITTKNSLVFGTCLLTYTLLFYFLFTCQLRLDFASFYSAALAYIQDANPYKNLIATYYAIPDKLPGNLNPPFFLQLISPLTQLDFKHAASLWLIISFVLGIIGATLSFKLSCSKPFYEKNWLLMVVIYLSMFSTLMNISIGQVGSILLFFIMSGYYFYIRGQDYGAGICWGTIMAIKLFPGLLLLFALSQKRYRVAMLMLLTFLLAFLWPYALKGNGVYSLYWTTLPRVLWFGDNWNASLYGFLFRLFVDVYSPNNVAVIKIVYVACFVIMLFWYCKSLIRLKASSINVLASDHRAFCLTLSMMLLMSPMGWLYYFSILLMPLTIIWQSLGQPPLASGKKPILWMIAIFLINLPLGYIENQHMPSIGYKISIFSCYFYGLLMISYLLSKLDALAPPALEHAEKNSLIYLYPLKITLSLGLFITLLCLLIHLTDFKPFVV